MKKLKKEIEDNEAAAQSKKKMSNFYKNLGTVTQQPNSVASFYEQMATKNQPAAQF